jgi:hypothetical protein
MVWQRLGLIGSPGWVRSSAWSWLFSSIDSTTAWADGSTHVSGWWPARVQAPSPTMSVSLAMKLGLCERLKVRRRCDCGLLRPTDPLTRTQRAADGFGPSPGRSSGLPGAAVRRESMPPPAPWFPPRSAPCRVCGACRAINPRPALGETLLPPPHCRPTDADALRHVLRRAPICRGKHDAAPAPHVYAAGYSRPRSPPTARAPLALKTTHTVVPWPHPPGHGQYRISRCGSRYSAGWPGVARYRGRVKRLYFRGDAAFANPEIYEFLEAEGMGYAIRLPTNRVLQDKIGHLLKRTAGRPPQEVRRYYSSFSYRAGSWTKPPAGGGQGPVAPRRALSAGRLHRHQPGAPGRAGRGPSTTTAAPQSSDQGGQGRNQVDPPIMPLLRRECRPPPGCMLLPTTWATSCGRWRCRVQIDTTLNRQNCIQNHAVKGRRPLVNRTAVNTDIFYHFIMRTFIFV